MLTKIVQRGSNMKRIDVAYVLLLETPTTKVTSPKPYGLTGGILE